MSIHACSSMEVGIHETKAKAKRKRTPSKALVAKPLALRSVKAPEEAGDIEDFSSEDALRIRSSLLRWYDEHQRVLPWRTRSSSDGDGEEEEEDRAYAVWVSEVMLQQTRVQTVIEYYNRWMARWPTLRLLAGATQEEVNEMWAGLGYYRRARFLLEGAKSIVQEGEFPRTASALRGVRGIGDYTAGAIASIAFNEAVPVVDGNVVRVISRLMAISANPKETSTVKTFWRLAGQLVDPDRPGDFNQAMMELGATLCSKTSPSCSACPVSKQCRAFLLSISNPSVKVIDYPLKVAKVKQRHDFAAVCVVEIVEDNNRPRYLLVKRPEQGLLAGLWEFPLVLIDEKDTKQNTRRKIIDRYLKKILELPKNCNVNMREDVGKYVHVFSHIRLHMYVELMSLTLTGGSDLLVNEEESSTVTRKIVDDLLMKSMGLTSGVRKVYNMICDFKKSQLMQKAPRTKTRRSIP
ncbi:A/G-specific adenine glycosylase MutY protein [Dioscorea alata]|uniref:A/G-specific adenine glycosylase MutY protein n=1 Tax=Dioscorea alata TaxID=55571 RepID=A0ACB7VB31_DIOAL|nr:A/G-specific adenine glycosylase MutY protein [Dioscorea alata]